MNLKYNRTSIGSKEFSRDAEGNVIKVPVMTNIKPYDSESTSIFFRGIANLDGRNGIKKGDVVYFKANNTRGVNYLGDTEESKGSCEDVAEVLCYYLLKNIKDKHKESFVLRGTPYEFADYSNDDFWKIVARQTGGMVESDRLYGCISKNAIHENGSVVRGNIVLRAIMSDADIKKSSKNTVFNYSKGLEALVKSYKNNGKELIIHPECNRFAANLMFFDYFISNADRHCMNIVYEIVPVEGKENTFMIAPISVLDNGGAFAMQSPSCERMYQNQVEFLHENGKLGVTNLRAGYHNPFMGSYDLTAGSEIFADSEIAKNFNNLSQVEQMIILASQNRTLFNDLKTLYNEMDIKKALADMKADLRFPVQYSKDGNYLPGMPVVLLEVMRFKKEQISKAMAAMMGEEFDIHKFAVDNSYYIDKFGKTMVKEDALTIHIAKNDELKKFKQSEAMSSYGK